MILVTGASGFIGSHLVPRLAANSRVRCVIRPDSLNKRPAHSAAETFPMDLSTADDFDEALRGVDCVIHLAALLRKKSAEEIRRVNAEATRKLVESSLKNGVKRFVFVSTENTLREDIHDPYSDTKREAEKSVKAFGNSVILRPCFVYGEGDTHGLGRLVAAARKGPAPLLFGGLRSLVQPVYVDDMVEYLIRAARSDVCGEFVVAGPETVSLNDFVLRALEISGEKRKAVYVPRSVFYLAALCGDAFLPGSGWGRTQLRNIYGSRTYSIDETVKAFGYAPRNIDAGLKAWLGKPRANA